MARRGYRGRGAGALQMTLSSQRLIATGFGGTLEAPDFILDAPGNGTIGIFLAVRFVGLLQVVGVAFEDHPSLFRV